MLRSFVPSLHYRNPASKLDEDFYVDCVNLFYHNGNNRSLLWDKNVKDIEQFVSGKFDLTWCRKLYKSLKKAANQTASQDGNFVSNNVGYNDIDWYCLPLITNKYNAAVALISKIPVEVTCRALDPLATKKKKEDITFIKNKPQIEADAQEVADKFSLDKIDIGGTKNSSVEFGANPYGLDLNEPDELDVFINLLYALKEEAALETILQIFYNLTNAMQVKLLEIRDQFKFGVSAHLAHQSDITGLPDLEYIYPLELSMPYSIMPDFKDAPYGFLEKGCYTPLDMANAFGSELCEDDLEDLINNPDYGYCVCNKRETVDAGTFNTFKVNLVLCAFKSIDYVGVISNPNKSRYSYITTDEDEIKEQTKKGNCTKIYGQNTYCAWWLKNTKRFFKREKLSWAHREKGLECYQQLPFNIYKSQERSPVELSIGENKAAQEAYIKLQHLIRMAKPPGVAIDLRFMRNALGGLKDEATPFTMTDLINNFFENNIAILDTEGFEGKNDGQFKPVVDIRGGLRSEEAQGFLTVIQAAKINIGQFMGVNDQVTGQAANPEGLVGLQKLLVNASVNSINWANEGIEEQQRKLFSNWSFIIKDAVKENGAAKQTLKDLVGAAKVELIDGIENMGKHQMEVEIKMTQREEERAEFKQSINKLLLQGVLNEVDEYMLKNIPNPKDQYALLAVRLKQFQKRKQQETAAQYAQQQAITDKQGQNVVASKQAEAQGEKEKVYAQGDVSAKLIQLQGQYDTQQQQIEGLLKDKLQDKRNTAQMDKAVEVLKTKADLEAQAAT